MRVVQASFVRDPRLRTGEEMLDAWSALSMSARAVAATGTGVTVVQAAWRDEEVLRDGIRYLFVAEPGLPESLSRRVQPRLTACVRSLAPDVIHVQGLGFPQVRALCGLGAAVIAQDHSGKPNEGVRRLAQRWWLARLDGVLFTARELADPFFHAGVFPRGLPVFEAHESTSSFTPGDVEEARRETGIGGDPCLLWLGHLDANKGPLTVLDAVSRVREQLPGIRLWMCYASAPLDAEVRARLAAEPALASCVTLLGRVPHERVEALCRAADFFVQASLRESSNYSLTEALACGATPLVSDISAFRRMTADGAAGGLFAARDADALARLLVDFAARPREPLRMAARAHFDRCLSLSALGRDLRAAYDAVVRR
jgi:glycosyltransferase involved in cell wall biosynthesis